MEFSDQALLLFGREPIVPPAAKEMMPSPSTRKSALKGICLRDGF
jgi:hypothetical protein